MYKIFKILDSPLNIPVFFFILIILAGSACLHFSEKNKSEPLSWTDSLFTATSAACVTGLAVVDTGSYFTLSGKTVILCLMQVGGLGIMTFSSLSLYLWRRKTTITDRLAVGQVLLHDPGFSLGRFLIEIVCWTFIIEAAGSVFLYLRDPVSFSPFSAVFHSVSAFCNGGFSLFSDNLETWKGDWVINAVIIILIITGGIGFSVFIEFKNFISHRIKSWRNPSVKTISWYSQIVLKTTVFLIFLGWITIYSAEFIGYDRMMKTDNAILTSLFQSVTCRTAGFNTLRIGEMTNVSLVIILSLMFIGGAPGSCAGGIKVTTFRVLTASIRSQLKGKKQTQIGKFAVNDETVKKAMTLFTVSIIIISLAVFLLDFTEGGDKPHYQVRGQFLELLFEAVSAFCTVGLSTGITPTLSCGGKWIIIILMFTGRIGPLFLINALQNIKKIQYYRLPEEKLMIG